MKQYLAVDIGASGGRHILGSVGKEGIVTREVHRFENNYIERDGSLVWDVEHLMRQILLGMEALRETPPVSVAIDTWGVDCVLLDGQGRRLGEVFAYRDRRTEGMDALLEKTLSFAGLYERTGTAKQPFNTLYQLMATDRAELEAARRCLLLPEYFAFRLSGEARSEYTIASTTALLNARSRDWDREVLAAAGIPDRLFPEKPLMPGTVLGGLTLKWRERLGYDCRVVFPASHDTGSAFMAIPARDERAAYLSSGTWSLLGTERDEPITTPEAQASGFTNEGGYGGKIRFLRNIMGMWILQSLRREHGKAFSYDEASAMAEEAARAPRPYPGRFDVSDNRFLAPAGMEDEIRSALSEGGFPPPDSLRDLLFSVYASLADCYLRSIRSLEQMTGSRFTSLNIVGGGSRDAALNRMTADAAGIPVYAGPAEGTALGNLIAQMIADGAVADLAEARDLLRRGGGVTVFEPSGGA